MRSQTIFSSGNLRGESFDSDDVTALYTTPYDVAILVSSWDKRSVCITEARHFRTARCIVLLFTTRDQLGLRDRHDEMILSFAQAHADEVKRIKTDSLKLDHTWTRILGYVVQCHGQIERPLRVFIDGSACPRYYLLGLVATALGSGLASRISVMYAEGRYPQGQRGETEDIAFTEGQWKAIAIPALEGHYAPGRKRFFLVSIGFEGWKTMRVVGRGDPDRVSILRPNPGTQPEYLERVAEDNAALIKQYCIPREQIVDAPAGDAIAAWRALTSAAVERPVEENSYYLCSGTKSHSLALGLRAMCLGTPAVLYNLPEGHRVVPIEATGRYWRFDIQSLTVPD